MKTLVMARCGALAALLVTGAQAQGISAEASAEVDGDAGGEAEAVQLDELPEEETSEPAPEPPPPEERADDGADDGDEEDADDGQSDHDKVVGRFAVGYLGRQTLHYGIAYTPVNAPVIGVRYWFTDLVGIDGGVGLSMLGGKATLTDADDVEAAGHTAMLLHVGVPLNLSDSKHFSFQVVPESNIGFASTGDQDPDDDIELRSRGTFFNIGAKVGAEIHFGFMNVPQLSLQGNVGLYLQMESMKDTFDDGDDVIEATDSYTSFGTTLGADPWDVFTSSISAFYYF